MDKSHEKTSKRPFRLGTTSFIVPDHIIPNVEFLGPFFDEIELLIFESVPKSVIPSASDVQRLKALSKQHDLTYNVHLPVDVSLTSPGISERKKACEHIMEVVNRFSDLIPTTYTLHLDMPKTVQTNADIIKWTELTTDGLSFLTAFLSDPGIISVETLDYPFQHVEAIVELFGFKVCIDAGHQLKYGYDLLENFKKHHDNIPLIHLHGVDTADGRIKDHVSLDKLSQQNSRIVKEMLMQFSGVVSLEVFNLDNLNASLKFLSAWFEDIPAAIKV